MADIVTIQRKPVIEIWESFGGSFWYITEKCHKQDSVINGKTYKDDQIMFGFVRLSHCPQFAEWGFISEAELKLQKPYIWMVPKFDWPGCPDVEVKDDNSENIKARDNRSRLYFYQKMKGGILKMDETTKQKLDEYFEIFDAVSEKTKNERITVLILQEICKDKRANMQKYSNGHQATEKQKKFMEKLGIDFPEEVTKKEASELIDEELKTAD